MSSLGRVCSAQSPDSNVSALNADTGTTGHFLCLSDAHRITNLKPTVHPREVVLADGSIIRSTHTGRLHLPSLPSSAQQCDVFPRWGGPLLSIGVLCDHGCSATFDADRVTISDQQGHVFLTGQRDPVTRLWMVPFPSPQAFSNAVVTEASGTQAEIVQFYSATMGNPTDATLCKALSTLGLELPGLTDALVRKFPPNSVATSKGHMRQAQHGRRSTKPADLSACNTEADLYPTPVPRSSPVASVYVSEIIRYSDLTGKFPVRGASGAQYLLIMSCLNYIHLETMPNREAVSHVAAYQRGHAFFSSHGIVPHFERMDNENAGGIKGFCDKVSPRIIQQLVPPNDHQGNKAERDIQTTKNHLIASLCSVDPAFPMEAWEYTVPQIEATLNLLRGSAFCPHVSAYHALRGPFHFSQTPMAPLGMKIVSFEAPRKRKTFAPHGVDGFYVHPAFQHYRCYSVYIPSTQKVRVTGQLSWHPPSCYRLPGAAPYDAVLGCLNGLRAAILQLTQTHPDLHVRGQPLSLSVPALTQGLDLLTSVFQPQDDDPLPLSSPTLPAPAITTASPRVVLAAPPQGVPTVSSPLAPAVSPRVLSYGSPLAPAASPRVPSYAVVRFAPTPRPDISLPPTPVASAPPICPVSDVPPTQLVFTDEPPLPLSPVVPPGFDVLPTPVLPAETPTLPDSPPTVAEPRRYPERARQPNRHLDGYVHSVSDRAHSRRRLRHSFATCERHYSASVQQVDAFAMDANNKPLTYRTAVRGPDALAWRQAEHEEFIRLIEHTKTMSFIDPGSKPSARTCSYYNPQVKLKMKAGQRVYRVRGTYGGNITDYAGLRSSGTADLQTVKLLLNAAVSEGAQIASGDAHDFYLATDLERPEYMWVGRDQIPSATLARYRDAIVWRDNRCMVRCDKGIYGLPQAGRLAHDLAITVLAKHGYTQCPNTPCLFRHTTRNIYFTLVVDDFLIKYTDKADVDHLCAALSDKWDFAVDWSASTYLGMRIDYNRDAPYVALSMPGYVEAALRRFRIERASKPTHSPLICEPIRYGAHVEGVTEDISAPLAAAQVKFIQEVIGVFLYYARTVDPTMLAPLNKLASRQAHPTEHLLREVHHFLQYAATWPSAQLVFVPSDMRLAIWSDASYLSETDSRSRAGGHHSMTSRGDFTKAPLNGAVDAISTILPTVVSAASEAEVGALFLNAQAAASTRATLLDLGYPQAATPIITDNTTAAGFANNSIRLKRSKAMDMRYNWIRDRTAHGEYTVTWAPGPDNLADYFTKAHPAHVYRDRRHHYVRDPAPPSIQP